MMVLMTDDCLCCMETLHFMYLTLVRNLHTLHISVRILHEILHVCTSKMYKYNFTMAVTTPGTVRKNRA